MSTTTFQTLREYAIDSYALGRRGTHDGGAVTTPADDSQFSGAGGAEGIENGSELLITSGTRDGDLCRVSQRPSIAAGLITCNPAPGGNLANADTFSVLYPGIRFEDFKNATNQALTEFMWERLLVPVTLVTDGDMLASGVTDWATDGSALVSKQSAAFPYGLRELKVTVITDIATDNVDSVEIAVEADASYYLEVTVRDPSVSSLPKLVLRDKTNSADITLDESEGVGGDPELLINPSVTIPSTCGEVQVRLGGVSDGANIAFFSNVIFRKNAAREFTLQDRGASVLKFGKLFATTNSNWGERGNLLDHPDSEVPHTIVQLPNGLWQYRTDVSLGGCSVWYEEFRTPATLSADSDTTSVPKEDLAAVATELMLRPKRFDPKWAPKWAAAAQRSAGVITRYQDGLVTLVNRARRVHYLATV